MRGSLFILISYVIWRAVPVPLSEYVLDGIAVSPPRKRGTFSARAEAFGEQTFRRAGIDDVSRPCAEILGAFNCFA